jgi:hypothetical protein
MARRSGARLRGRGGYCMRTWCMVRHKAQVLSPAPTGDNSLPCLVTLDFAFSFLGFFKAFPLWINKFLKNLMVFQVLEEISKRGRKLQFSLFDLYFFFI